jgi:catechol 2,3-dioxygenase-like lactoylglutathione lyase family enzyme
MQPGARIEPFLASADLDGARAFYEGVLGLTVVDVNDFALTLDGMGSSLRITQVPVAPQLSHTVLGWVVPDITAAVGELTAKGVVFNRYDGFGQDDDGVWTTPGGDRVAWFTDPDGNVLSFAQLG